MASINTEHRQINGPPSFLIGFGGLSEMNQNLTKDILDDCLNIKKGS